MNRNIRITVILCLAVVLLVFFFTYLRITRNNATAEVSPETLREMGALVYERPVTLDEFSVVTAPYEVDGKVVGTVAVIGPTRMAYERVIPVVDMTARLLSSALSQH